MRILYLMFEGLPPTVIDSTVLGFSKALMADPDVSGCVLGVSGSIPCPKPKLPKPKPPKPKPKPGIAR